MNINKQFCIRIKEALLVRYLTNECKKGIVKSPLKRGIYCAVKLRYIDTDCLLCIALNKREVIRYFLFNAKKAENPKELIYELCDFAKENNADRLILSKKAVSEEDFPYTAALALYFKDELKRRGISLIGYYLTDGADFENLITDT